MVDKEKDSVRITITIPRKTAEKIGELAVRLNASESKTASWLVEQAVEDNEWIIKLVTSWVMAPLKKVFKSKGTRKDAE